jgi:hypothetical protein
MPCSAGTYPRRTDGARSIRFQFTITVTFIQRVEDGQKGSKYQILPSPIAPQDQIVLFVRGTFLC